NVLAVELLTVEEEPRRLRLEGADVRPVLHTYGTIGVVTRVEMRLVPAHDYTPVIAVFDRFADAAGFGWDLVSSPVHARLVGLSDHEQALDELLNFCTSIGMTVLNPHSYVVEEGGFVGDTARVVELKQSCDPYDILNPGKLGDGFFTSRGLTPPSARALAQP